MQKLKALLIIIRPVNALITSAAIIIAGIISAHNAALSQAIVFAAAAGFLATGAGNVINDYFDVEIDKINRPDRVLPRNLLTPREALIYYTSLNISALLFAYLTNAAALLITLIAEVMLFFYSYKLKSLPLIGNLTVSALTGLAFIYGGVAVNSLSSSFFPALFAFLINTAREILKDLEDIEGDKSHNLKTTAIVLGEAKSKLIITITILILIPFTTVPYFTGLYGFVYFLIVMIFVNTSLIYFLKELNLNFRKEKFGRLSSILKLDMIIGLLAIWLGS